MIKPLFVGTFISDKQGTRDVAEELKDNLLPSKIYIDIVSKAENKWIRLFHILFELTFTKSECIVFNVFSGSAFKITQYGSIILKIRRKKPLFILHGGALPDFYNTHIALVTKIFRRADRILTPSLYLQKYFIDHGFRIDYLPNSVNLKKFPYSFGKSKPRSLLWVRAFTDIYHPEIAIKALEIIRKKYPETVLTMVGPDKGSLRKIKNLISDLNISNAVFLAGPVNNDLLYKYYHEHEVFLNTTSYESFGVAVVEAAACGIPVVSSKVGEIPYIWTDQINILLVDSFTPESYASKIEMIFADQSLANTISRNARIKAETFSWEAIGPKWNKILSSRCGEDKKDEINI